MADPKSDGRMIRKEISDSDKFAALSPEAAVLFAMLIPHYNSYGKLPGGPAFIKEIVCPKISYIPIDFIPLLLSEISKKTIVKWFEYDLRNWLHSVNFLSDHQKLNPKKLGRDLLPTYPGVSPDLLRTYSGLSPDLVKHSPDLVHPEVEVEVEVEVEGKSGLSPGLKPEYEPDMDHLDALAQGVWLKVLEAYPEAGLEIGLADGAAVRVFADAILHSEHGQFLQAVLNYAADVADCGTPARYIKRLVNFMQDNYWRNWIGRRPSGERDAEEALLEAARDKDSAHVMPGLPENAEKLFHSLNIPWPDLSAKVRAGGKLRE